MGGVVVEVALVFLEEDGLVPVADRRGSGGREGLAAGQVGGAGR
jgi:hypothetical protein